jgi:hypothetical protein
VRRLNGDRGRARQMGRAARAKLESEHSPELHCDRIVEIYERVMQ